MTVITVSKPAAVKELKRRGRWPGSERNTSKKAQAVAQAEGTKGLSRVQLFDIAGADVSTDAKTAQRVAKMAQRKAAPKTRKGIASFSRKNPLGLSGVQLIVREAIRKATKYGQTDEFDFAAYATEMDSAGIPRQVKKVGDTTRPTHSRGKRFVTEGSDELATKWAKAHKVGVAKAAKEKILASVA